MFKTNIKPIHIFLFFLSFYLLSFSFGGAYSYFYSIDGKVEYGQTIDIVKGDLSLLVKPRKHLGISLFQIPFFIIGELLSKICGISFNPPFTLLLNSVVTAASCVILYLIAKNLSTEKTAVILVLIYGFATLAWPYAKFDTSDPLLAFTVLLTFWSLLQYKVTRREKWFFFSLIFMVLSYMAKLVAHIFIIPWLVYLYLIEKESQAHFKSILLKYLWVIIFWLAVIPISINVNKAHSSSYGWTWFKEFWYKILIRGFSPLDGFLVYMPIAIFVVISLKKFITRYKNEAITVILLLILYNLLLLMGTTQICIYDFAGRYDTLSVPFVLLLLIPFIEKFSSIGKPLKILFFAILFVQFYIQFLGASIDILYYSNLLGGCLGVDWKKYAFSWYYSPFGIYPFLLIKLITGIEIPIKGITNVSASIVPALNADYLCLVSTNPVIRTSAVLFLALFLFCGFLIVKKSNLITSFRKYYWYFTVIISLFIVLWVAIFVPPQFLLRHDFKPLLIPNSGFEEYDAASGSVLPLGWTLIDCSSQNGQPSVTLSPNTRQFKEGAKSLAIAVNQGYVTVSLASPAFELSPRNIVSAKCLVGINNTHAESIRIAFINAQGNTFYWSTTTRIQRKDARWKELETKCIAPKGTVKASLWINIWGGGLKKGETILFDNVTVAKSEL